MKTILSIMLVLAMAGSVMAEPCSTPWVLWHKMISETGSEDSRNWKVVKAYDHHKDCEAQVTEALTAPVGDQWKDVNLEFHRNAAPPWVHATYKLKGNVTTELFLYWNCLPNGTKPTD